MDINGISYLQGSWSRLCPSPLFESYSTEEKVATFNKIHVIMAMYDDPKRTYHNLDHVLYCLKEVDKIEAADKMKLAMIRMAIWFHDIIYTASSGDEEQSAKLMNAMFISNPFKNIDVVTDMILKTATHGQNYKGKLPGQYEVFLDIDMTILAETEDNYKEYCRKIADEYRNFHNVIPNPEINGNKIMIEGRCHFLQSLVDAPFILFNEVLNKRAVDNVTKELKLLRESLE